MNQEPNSRRAARADVRERIPAPSGQGGRQFLWRLEQSSGDQVAAKLVEDNPEWAELLHATEAPAPHTMLGAAEVEEKLEIDVARLTGIDTEATDG